MTSAVAGPVLLPPFIWHGPTASRVARMPRRDRSVRCTLANDTLLTLIAGTLGIEPTEVTDGSDMSNTRKWDSLPQIMLMTELEVHFGIELSDQQILETTSVAKIRALLSLHGWPDRGLISCRSAICDRTPPRNAGHHSPRRPLSD